MNCNFCDKNREHVKFMIAGPDVYICDECVEIASAIIAEELDKLANPPETSYEYEDEENG